MVDAVVSFVVQKMGDYLIERAVFFQEVRNEVVSLKRDLEWMQAALKDAEERQHDDQTIRQWVSEVRDIAYDTEDVLDEFMIKVGDRQSNVFDIDDGRGTTTSKEKTTFFASIFNCSCISAKSPSSLRSKGKEVCVKYSIGKEIEALKKQMDELSRRRELFGFKSVDIKVEGTRNALGKLKQLRRVPSYAVEENVVGFEDDTNKLLADLLDEESQRFIVAIYGMGGLGKTTLAGKLYHHPDIKDKFNCRAWVTVSQDYKILDLLRRILKSFEIRIEWDELEKMDEEDLERILQKYLHYRSYLVVIDDVWEKEAWGCLKRAFPDNKKGSRVIITTRNKEVAKRADERTVVHKHRFLRPDESWQLFYDKAFRISTVDEGLVKLGEEMVQKCRGLPLAIVVLAGLLSKKKSQEWKDVHSRLWQHLEDDSIEISYLLTLSFNDLPYQLKLCFLYIGLFPEDYEIEMAKLIRLLVAEGFIPPDDNQIMEDVAGAYLQELIDRSLIQVGERKQGRVITCRVHDLLRALAIQKAKELSFIYILDEMKSSNDYSKMSSCRRQAVYCGGDKCSWHQHCNPRLRSLLFFHPDWSLSQVTQLLTTVCTDFRLLRVLNINGKGGGPAYLSSFPKEIGKLIHLRYLALESICIPKLSPSIGNLQSLQTLHLFGNDEVELPAEICKLQELRHLMGQFKGRLPIANLINLQTLRDVDLESWSNVNPENLVNLRELCIKGWAKKDFNFDIISKLKRLRLLVIRLFDEFPFASLQPLSHCQDLLHLHLTGNIEKLPEDMHKVFPKLEFLFLESSQLKEDPMPILQKLPNLMTLVFSGDVTCGKKLMCATNGFPRLQFLVLYSEKLEELQVEEGAMPVLTSLSILNKNCELKITERLRSVLSYTSDL